MSNSFPARQAPSREKQCRGEIDLDKARYLHVILAPSHGRDLYLTRRLRTAPTGPRPRRRNLLAPPAGALSTNVGFPVTTRGGDLRGRTGSGFTIGDITEVIPEPKACAHHGITKLLTSRPHRPPRNVGLGESTWHAITGLSTSAVAPSGSANVAAAMEQ